MSILIECCLDGFWKKIVQRTKEQVLIMYFDENRKNTNDDFLNKRI